MTDKRINAIAELLDHAEEAQEYVKNNHSILSMPKLVRISIPMAQYEEMRIKAEAFDKIDKIMKKKEEYWWNH